MKLNYMNSQELNTRIHIGEKRPHGRKSSEILYSSFRRETLGAIIKVK